MITNTASFFICLIGINNLWSQEVKNYNKEWNNTSKAQAFYKEETLKQNDTNYVVSKWNINKILIFKGNFFSVNPDIENGKLIYYYENGRISAEEEYIMGQFYGEWKYYDTTGNLIEIINYTKAYHYLKYYQNSDNQIEAFYNCDTMPLFIYPNDSIDIACHRKEQYYKIVSLNQENIKIEAKIYNYQLLTHNKEIFDEHINNFNNFIDCRIRYPRRALKNKISGNLVITFTVDNKGYIVYPILRNNGNKDLFFEVCRVLFDSPKWKIGYENALPVNVSFVLPTIFIIN